MILASFDGLWDNLLAGAIFSIACLSIGWFWGRWRAMMIWRSKEFKDRVVLALNTLQSVDGKSKLSLRTLFEKDLRDVLQNDSMVRIVEKAVEEATIQNPVLPIPQEDCWYVLNAVLNKIAEQFASGILRRDMGLPVHSKRYTFCLTFEKEGGIRMQKIRIMIIDKETLQNFPESGEFLLESDKHATRVQTLRILKQELQNHPHFFMDIELYQ